MKKLMPEHKEYWIKKGMSEEEAGIQSQRMAGGRSKWNPNYWMLRGYTYDLAIEQSNLERKNHPATHDNRLKRFDGDEEAYAEWIAQNCPLSKTNMLKKMTEEEYTEKVRNHGKRLIGNSPNDISYWIKKGFTEDEAKEKVHQSAIENSARRVEYWIKRGYSEEEAVIKVSTIQDNTSLESFIARYGEEEGQIRYNKYIDLLRAKSKVCIEYWLSLGYSEEDAVKKISEHQSEVSKRGPANIRYWLDRGYDEEAAEQMRLSVIRSKFANCTAYWLDRGYDLEEAQLMVKQTQSSRGKLGMLAQLGRARSKLEQIFDEKTNQYEKIWPSSVERKDGSYYFPDFEFKGCFVEIYGDYWHANPSLYGPESKIKDYIAKDKWKKDGLRIEEIQEITGKPVFIIWESDFNKPNVLEEKIYEISKYF